MFNTVDPMVIAMASTFWATDIGAWAKAVLGAVGVVVVIFACIKAAGSFLGGKVGKGATILLSGIVVGAFMLRPELFDALLSTMGDLLDKGVTSVDQIGGTGVKDNG